MIRKLTEQMGQMDLSEEEFRRFRDFIASRSGIHFDSSTKDNLETSLLSRLSACGLRSFADYYRLLSSSTGVEEFDHLLNLITIQETYFFRDQAQFMALKRYVIPEILKSKSNADSKLRIWSAGCSSGEEPYTIAMIVAEGTPGVIYPPTQIVATDVSHHALEAAQCGIYRDRALRATPEHYRHRFFSQQGDSYILDDAIKRMVEFRYFNLISEPYPLAEMSDWDIIFCRNVTIYFKQESTKRVIHNFYESLREGGYLFTGFSESLRYISDEFVPVQLGGIFLYQKKAAGEVTGERRLRSKMHKRLRSVPAAHNRKRPARTTPGPKPAASQEIYSRAKELLEDGLPEEARQLLASVLEQTSPPAEAILLQAEIALNQGDLAGAEDLCRRAIQQRPLSVDGHFLLGIIYRSMEEENSAVEVFRKVVYLKPDHALAHFQLGELYARLADRDAAEREYANTVRLLRECPESFDNRFAGGFSLDLLIDTCRSRLETLGARQRFETVSV